jgi:RimJ/RimL family protein N-acetyltransferase/N-acetylglutamate synthase-like GNAT family acetyltransferase
MVAEDNAGQMVGFGRISQPPWFAAGDLQLALRVDIYFRHQGIGAGFYERLLAVATQQAETKRLFAYVLDYLPDALAFAKRRGFQIDRHIFESALDTETFDETPFTAVLDAAVTSGITFTTLAQIGDTPENRHKLYRLHQQVAADIPGSEHPDFDTLELFEQAMFPEGSALPDAVIVALAGDEWIGYTALTSLGDPNMLNHFMTGVDRRYRGQKLALAIKLLSIRYAKEHGIKYLETSNDSANAPMLAINEKLGYQRRHGAYTLIKSLS